MPIPPAQIQLDLIDNKVKFRAVSQGNPDTPVIFDYAPPLGSGEGFAGIEMLSMTFAACVSTAILGLLKRRGRVITDYEMSVIGHKHEEPLYLEAIEFAARVGSADATETDLQEVLAWAEKISPAWLAMKGNVRISGTLELK